MSATGERTAWVGTDGHKLPRERLSAMKFMGTVIAWKGKYGWIKPKEEIPHEKANLHRGSLFASKDDLIDCQKLEVGEDVEFHLWVDDSGLGAEEITQIAPAPHDEEMDGFLPKKAGIKASTSAGKGGSSDGTTKGGHMLPRARISAEKFQGIVAAWKGKYGWINPAEEIPHEKANLHKGSLFAGKDDILMGQALEVGAPVEFHIWADETGLGAEEIEQTGPVPFGNAESFWSMNRGKGGLAPMAGAGAWSGVKGPPTPASRMWSGAAAKGFGKGCWAPPMMVQRTRPVKPSISKVTGGEKGKGDYDAKGHLLPRTRVSEEKLTGTVAAWKGKYGWIEPTVPIEHEKAQKHKGGIFVGKDDLIEMQELEVGAVVEFCLWEDASGLGAEEVTMLQS